MEKSSRVPLSVFSSHTCTDKTPAAGLFSGLRDELKSLGCLSFRGWLARGHQAAILLERAESHRTEARECTGLQEVALLSGGTAGGLLFSGNMLRPSRLDCKL